MSTHSHRLPHRPGRAGARPPRTIPAPGRAAVLLRSLAALALLAASGAASAQSCRVTSGDGPPSIQLPDTLVVPSALAVGELISSIRGPDGRIFHACPAGSGRSRLLYDYARRPHPAWSGNARVHRTNVPGVGVRIYVRDPLDSPKDVPFIYHGGSDHDGSTMYGARTGLWYEFIKIGDVQAGTIEANALPTLTLKLHPGNDAASVITVGTTRVSGSPRIILPNCSIDVGDRSQSIRLDDVRADTLQGRTTTVTNPVEFKVRVAGCSNTGTVRFRVRGANNGWFFNNEGTAAGVKVRLEERSSGRWTLVRADGSDGLDARELAVSAGANSAEIPLRVGYVNYGGDVRAGTVQATLTVDVDYR